jgi:hypothetical protein
MFRLPLGQPFFSFKFLVRDFAGGLPLGFTSLTPANRLNLPVPTVLRLK